MIMIAGDMKINLAHRDEAVKAMIAMNTASQAEVGCITYEFSADLEAADTFHLFEIWENEEVLAAHGQTPHMATFRDVMGRVRVSSNIKRYRAESL